MQLDQERDADHGGHPNNVERVRPARKEALYLGIVEMEAEGKDETFSKVGEVAYHQELAKKMMARRMTMVRREMDLSKNKFQTSAELATKKFCIFFTKNSKCTC